jgi:hypothetical protein
MHVPFGTKYNIYGFLDTGNAQSSDNIGGALKYEFLAGNTEMAFSGWVKKSYKPVIGYDFSTRLKDVDIVGEVSASQKDNTMRIKGEQGVLKICRPSAAWAPRASMDFSKGFRLGNFNDRLIVTSEFYYNHTGYKENIFADDAVYGYAAPIAAAVTGTKKDYLILNGLYAMHNYSRFYGAVFTSIGRFIITDMTFNLNYIRNIDDDSGIVSTGVSYKNINDLSAGLLVNVNLGPENREYTYSKEKCNVQLTIGLAF